MKNIILIISLAFGSIHLVTQNLNDQQPIEKHLADFHQTQIAYIGNMGVLIKHKNKTVIIDGFHKEYKPEYAFPSKELVQKLISGTFKNYGNIEIALSTHHHKDHFDPGYVKDFLVKNPTAITIVSPQINDALQTINKDLNSSIDVQIQKTEYKESLNQVFTHKGIRIKAFKCDHVNPTRHHAVQNTAYLVYLDDCTFLHLGDTNWDVAQDILKTQKIKEENIDIAILPYWMLLEPSSVNHLNSFIAANKIIATHLPPDFSLDEQEALKAIHTDIILFTKIGEEISY